MNLSKYFYGRSFVLICLMWIHSDICSCQICLYEYIHTFVRERIRVWKLFEWIQKFIQFSIPLCIRTYVHVKFCWNIFRHLFLSFINTDIYEYSFLLKLLGMSHSGPHSTVLGRSVLWMESYIPSFMFNGSYFEWWQKMPTDDNKHLQSSFGWTWFIYCINNQ